VEEFGKFPSVSNLIARLCNNLLRTTELYLNTENNLHDPKNTTQSREIESHFELPCQEVLSCVDKVTFLNHTLDHSDNSTALQKLAVFRNVNGTQDLCSALGDVLRTILMQQGSCSIEEFRKYYRSEITFPTNP